MTAGDLAPYLLTIIVGLAGIGITHPRTYRNLYFLVSGVVLGLVLFGLGWAIGGWAVFLSLRGHLSDAQIIQVAQAVDAAMFPPWVPWATLVLMIATLALEIAYRILGEKHPHQVDRG